MSRDLSTQEGRVADRKERAERLRQQQEKQVAGIASPPERVIPPGGRKRSRPEVVGSPETFETPELTAEERQKLLDNLAGGDADGNAASNAGAVGTDGSDSDATAAPAPKRRGRRTASADSTES